MKYHFIHLAGVKASSRVREWAICASLVVITAIVYSSVPAHEFTMFDDGSYITENTQVQKGITWEGIVWAFTTGHGGNWHPVTWLSHMLDCQIFGLNPAGHHLTSLLIHLASTVSLFLIFHRMTSAFWPSAFVAAIFAIHPLHVESVAWAAERKDVLSGLFWMLTLGAYALYVKTPTAVRYALLLILFALGLMSKPMIVTLPFVLFLLDYWPLRRISLNTKRTSGRNKQTTTPTSLTRIIIEKIPLLLLAIGSSLATFWAQQQAGAVLSRSFMPPGARFDNAMYAYVQYMKKTVWPFDLAVFYPHVESTLAGTQVALFALCLIAIFWVVYKLKKSHPYLLVGWLWFFGTLVPVIGIVQVGGQSMADRYMYLPLVGLAIMVAWGGKELIFRLRVSKLTIGLVSSLVITGMGFRAWSQVQTWRDDIALFTQASSAVPNNTLAYNNLGVALQRRGKLSEAVEQYRHALTVKNDYENAHGNLMGVLMALNRNAEAAEAANKIGEIMGKQGRYESAESHLREALRFRPDYADAHNNLGIVLALQGKNEEAAEHFKDALHSNPGHKDARYNLEVIVSKKLQSQKQ